MTGAPVTGDAVAGDAATAGRTGVEAVVFDLGGVVLRWDPHAAYGQVLPAAEIDDFLAEIAFPDWNRAQDGGRSWADGEAELIARLPHRAQAIRAYRRHFAHAIPEMVPGTAGLIARLGQAGVRLLALTNWAADTFAETRERFDVLHRFESIMVSGEEQLTKPDPGIFARLIERSGLDPERTLFVDDAAANTAAAVAAGLQSHTFTDAAALGAELTGRGLLPSSAPPGPTVYHLAERAAWAPAQSGGDYPWSSRRQSYQQAGFVHCSYREQTAGVRQRFFGDVADAELVLLELKPGPLAGPIVVEDGFPHLFAPLGISDVAATTDWVERPVS